ncbi:unnamed protein product, partial [Didymodactylos carnosus]
GLMKDVTGLCDSSWIALHPSFVLFILRLEKLKSTDEGYDPRKRMETIVHAELRA